MRVNYEIFRRIYPEPDSWVVTMKSGLSNDWRMAQDDRNLPIAG